MGSNPQAYILAGPTATGKSAVAHFLAQQAGRSICSADSMAVYRKMDVATAKPSLEQRGDTVYYGIDLVSPDAPFSVADWLKAIRPAFHPGAPLPIVAGGTGLYLNCLLQGMDLPASGDPDLRERAESMSLEQLQEEARRTHPAGYAALADPGNPRRLIRLIEQGVEGEPATPTLWKVPPSPIAGLMMDRSLLHERIQRRVEAMYCGGLIDEARALLECPASPTARQAIGYAEVFSFLRGELERDEAIRRTVIRTRRLAKRQMTWFRHQLRVEWIDAGPYEGDVPSLAEAVQSVWDRQGPSSLRGVTP